MASPSSKFAFALLLAATVLGTACSKKAPAPNTTSESGSKKTAAKVLLYGNGGEVQDIDPQAVTGIPEHKVITALLEGLVSEDPHDLHPVPGVAESWDISADGRVYTFHLRANARWSNGDPVTAEDFVRSYQRILTPELAAEYAYMIYNYVVGAKDFYDGKLKDFSQVGFRAVDPHTLEVRLLEPTPYLLSAMTHYAWFPVHIPTLMKFDALKRRGTNWTRVENFVGNGPFVLKEWRQNQVLIVERSPTYWDRDRVKLDAIHFFPVDNLDTEERMFRTGQLHVTYEVPTAKIDVYRKENPAALHTDPYLGVYFFRFNVKRKPFDDVRVRKALALGIDREMLVKSVVRGDQRAAYALSYPNNQGYTSQAQLRGTVEDAQRLLAEAGYPGGKGFPKVELTYNTQQNNKLIAEAIQQMWRKNLGIDVSVANLEWKVYLDAQHSLNYDVQRAGWIADYVDPNVFMDLWESTSGNNDTGWGNPEYDRLLAESLRAKTNAERYEIYQKMDQILIDELPAMPIYYYNRVILVSPKLRGYYPTLLDNHPWKYVDIAD